MLVERGVIEGLLRMRGEHHQSDRAREELPDMIDTDREAVPLARLGVHPRDLAGLEGL